MLSIEQSRGARGILGWTQQDLADASGLSKTAINNFEKGHSDMKVESLKAIRLAFESADIEFLEHNGLRKRREDMVIYRGQSAHMDLMNDISRTLKANDSTKELLIVSTKSPLIDSTRKKRINDHTNIIKENKIEQRILCIENRFLNHIERENYRWLSSEALNTGITTFIYADKVAFELWENAMILVVKSADVNRAEKSRFEQLWSKALILPKE